MYSNVNNIKEPSYISIEGESIENTSSETASQSEAEWAIESNASESSNEDEMSINEDSESDVSIISTEIKSTKRKLSSSAKNHTVKTPPMDENTSNSTSKRKKRRRKLKEILQESQLEESTRRAREAERRRQLDINSEIDAIFASFTNFPVTANPPLLNSTNLENRENAEGVVEHCLNPGGDASEPRGSVKGQSFVHPSIAKHLKPHQLAGARFLWSHIARENTGFGCVLADFMGLGKTIQVITTIEALLALKKVVNDTEQKNLLDERVDDEEIACIQMVPRYKHVLILAPTICVRNWESEFVKWLGKKYVQSIGVRILESARSKKMDERIYIVKQWYSKGGVLVMGYELYRNLVLQAKGLEPINKTNENLQYELEAIIPMLCDPGPDCIVLDEGHRVRDHKSKLVKALSYVGTKRRVLLTGYPLQNHLEEYWTMVNFARPDYLGSLDEFKNRFVAPIKEGTLQDSSEMAVKLARQRAYVLTQELRPLVLRRDQQFLFSQLPEKKEWVLYCKLSKPQADLYRLFLDQGIPIRGSSESLNFLNDVLGVVGLDATERAKINVLGGYHISIAISNHPDVLYHAYRELEAEARQKLSEKRHKSPLTQAEIDRAEFANGWLAERNLASSEIYQDDEECYDSPLSKTYAPDNHRLSFAREFMESYKSKQVEASGKMVVLLELLCQCKAINDRVIVFSQSIPTLNAIEYMIRKNRNPRFSYLRIDGSTPQKERYRMIQVFNDWEEDVDIILISTKAGGEGINLCAGNRIVIFDVCWNPCNDSQSMCRSYRFGQTKPVFVYRFVSYGTMEKKVYDLQIRKEGVAKRIVDEKSMERRFKSTDLAKYFNKQDFEESLTGWRCKEASKKGKQDALGNTSEVTRLKESKSDVVLNAVLNKYLAPDQDELGVIDSEDRETKWVLDWFEQETMFEEDLDCRCSPDEEEELLATYKYMKALAKYHKHMRFSTSNIETKDLRSVTCNSCRATVRIYPESVTKVPVPKYIECTYCKQTVNTVSAVEEASADHFNFDNLNAPNFNAPPAPPLGLISQGPVFSTSRVLPSYLTAGVTNTQNIIPSSYFYGNQMYSQPIPPLTQSLQSAQLISQEQPPVRQKPVAFNERCVLVLRRGLKGYQNLKDHVVACGARIAIEVDSQLTDIVSAMSLNDTLNFLQLSKLPNEVDFHDVEWLKEQIELYQSKDNMSYDSTESKPTLSELMNIAISQEASLMSSRTIHDNNPQMINLIDDLMDSDEESQPSVNNNPIDYGENLVVID